MKVCMLVPFPLKNEIKPYMIGNGYHVNLAGALNEVCSALDLTIFADIRNKEETLQQYKNVKIKRCWPLGKLNPFKLFKEILKMKPDFFHIQYVLGAKYGKGFYLINPFLLMLLVRIARIPLLITIHDIIPANKLFYTFKEMFKKQNPISSLFYVFSYILATSFMGKIASKIIVLDEGTKKWAVKHYGYSKNKMELIPHGMVIASENISAKEAKKILKINGKWNLLLFFGKIHPRKGIEYAIKALPFVIEEHSNTKLLVAGSFSGSWEKESESYLFSLKKMAKNLGVENHVLFDIKFFGEEIPIIFGAADIVLLPYVVPYGASGVLKLAATYKKSVIFPGSLSRMGEITNGISGVILPVLNERILAQKINQLLDEKPLLVKMGSIFYEQNITSSEWRNVAEKTLDCYKSIGEKRKIPAVINDLR